MDTKFMEVRSTDGQQMFLNTNTIVTFKQAKGNNAGTEIMLSSGHTFEIATQYHEFRKSLGLDKK
jgi:competence transcription factor ComK